MKYKIAVILVLSIVLSLCGCRGRNNGDALYQDIVSHADFIQYNYDQLKEAAEIIAESCREDCEEMGFKSIREMIKCYRMDKEDMLSEFVGALQDANADIEFYYTDDGEVFEANELTPHTFDELIAEVKKYKL